MSYKEAAWKVTQLLFHNEYRDALEAARHCVMRYHNVDEDDLDAIILHIGFTDAEHRELMRQGLNGCAWSCLVLGLLYGDNYHLRELWLSSSDCPVATMYLGRHYQHDGRMTKALELFLVSARAGNWNSMFYAAQILWCHDGNAADAAMWCARAIPGHDATRTLLRYLLDYYESDVVPLGRWEPTRVHWRLLTRALRQQLIHWLLVARRLGVVRDIAVLICGFIVTR